MKPDTRPTLQPAPNKRPTLEPIAADTIAGGDMIRDLDDHLARLANDIFARPDNLRKRKLTLSIILEPKGGGGFDLVSIDYSIDLGIPKRLGARQDGLMQIDETTGEQQILLKVDTFIPANDPRQSTILDTFKETE